MNQIVSLNPKKELFDYARLLTGAGKGKAETKMKKWTCGCTIVRCAVDLQATCTTCDNVFELED